MCLPTKEKARCADDAAVAKKRKTGYDARSKKFTQQVNIERRGGSTGRSAKVRRVRRRNRDVTEEEFEL
jgi:hypothetical protein